MTKAKWIWKNKEFTSDEYAVFCDEFDFSGNSCSIDISVCGDYVLYVNGNFAAFNQYADYKHYKVFDRIDISEFIIKGKNVIKIAVWYQGVDAFSGYDFGAGLIYEVEGDGDILCYSKAGVKAGELGYMVSGKNKWITLQLGLSYTFDARKKEQFNTLAVELNSLSTQLNIRTNKKLVFGERVLGELIDQNKKIYDLKKECCGFLIIKFKCKNGQKLRVSYGEHINDGKVRDIIGSRDFSVELIGNGETVEFIGLFRRLGLRYLQVDNADDAVIEYIGIQEVIYPFNVLPYKASNSLRQKIYDTSLRTLTLCAHEHYEDCPWREQSMYLQDTRNQMLCGYYAFDNVEMQKSAIELFMQGQREDGLFEICFPAKCEFTIPSFSLVFPLIVLEYTQKVLDTTLLEKALPCIEKMLKYFLDRIDGEKLFKTVSAADVWHFYEWADGLDGNFFSEDLAAKNRNCYDSLINSFLSIALQKTAEIYYVLGKSARAAEFEKIATNINKAVFDKFFDCQRKLFKISDDKGGFSVLNNALCLLSGACEKQYQERVAEVVAIGEDGVIKNTLSMNIFRFDALIKVNEEKYSSFILNEIDQTYKNMLDQGATSFWETEKGEADFDGAGSLCHGWSAIPIYYYRTLGENGVKEKRLDKQFSYVDTQMRNRYRDSVTKYIDARAEELEEERKKVFKLTEEQRREILISMLGEPLTGNFDRGVKLIEKQKVISTSEIVVERLTFKILDKIEFSGYTYNINGDQTENKALVVALHGGGGTPELIGNLFMDSANYNNVVRRVLKKGVTVFAPQLMLWNTERFGSVYDREKQNRRLIQQGGSFTALEVFTLMRSLDYFIENFDIDKDNIGVIGLSYGGMYALHFGAVDTRIKSVVSSCWFNDRAKFNWHDYTYFNAEKVMFDAQLASLILPRKLYIEVGKNDSCFTLNDSEKPRLELIDFAKEQGYRDKLKITIFDGEHEFDKNDGTILEFLKDLGVKNA